MPGPERAALGHLFEEARTVLQTQRQTLMSLDQRAAELLRFNVLVTGLMVTAASFLARTGGLRAMESGILLPLFAAGVLLLAGSTFFAILAHRAEKITIGLRPEDIVRALDYDASEPAFLAEAIRSYSEGIAANAGSRDRAVVRLQWAAWSALGAVILLSAMPIALIGGGLP